MLNSIFDIPAIQQRGYFILQSIPKPLVLGGLLSRFSGGMPLKVIYK